MRGHSWYLDGLPSGSAEYESRISTNFKGWLDIVNSFIDFADATPDWFCVGGRIACPNAVSDVI